MVKMLQNVHACRIKCENVLKKDFEIVIEYFPL